LVITHLNHKILMNNIIHYYNILIFIKIHLIIIITLSGMHPCINSIGAFREHSYASICSLNFPEKGEVVTVSGLDTEQTPASIEWVVTASAFTPTAGGGLVGNYLLTDATNCLPYLICAYSSHLEIGAGRVINLIP